MRHKTICLARYASSVWVGVASKKSHTRAANNPYSFTNRIHAELAALIKLPVHLDGRRVKITVLRVNIKTGVISMSKPCFSCQNFLRNRGIALRNIQYSGWNGEMLTMNEWEI